MICPKCGEDNHYILKNCKHCGSSLRGEEPQPTPQVEPRKEVRSTAFLLPPPVMTWYRVYVVLLLIATALSFFYPTVHPEKFRGAVTTEIFEGLVAVFFFAYLVSFFIPNQPWAWIYHLVLICLGFGSCCCLPIGIPLLIFWIKPETRAYFGMT